MDRVEILKNAKALLTEGTFCQLTFAKNADGGMADPSSAFARRWCAAGAILKVGSADGEFFDVPDETAAALEALAKAIRPDEVCDTVEKMVEIIAEANDRAGLKELRPDLALKRIHKHYDAAIEALAMVPSA